MGLDSVGLARRRFIVLNVVGAVRLDELVRVSGAYDDDLIADGLGDLDGEELDRGQAGIVEDGELALGPSGREGMPRLRTASGRP
jgi:hypothetical protein